ncbi:hypothetical protein KC573_04555, partial [candidate division WWE3 bacterium]|nr:hypothetical protein [candidate division WWE3 bacterium]
MTDTYTASDKSKDIKTSLQSLHSEAKKKLSDAHPKAWKAITTNSVPVKHIVTKTKHAATSAALAGTLLASTTPAILAGQTTAQTHKNDDLSITKPEPPVFVSLQQSLTELLPFTPHKLTQAQSDLVSIRLKNLLGVKAVSELDGFSLNTDYGYMGAEQHLPRFAGDTIQQHDEFQASGITKSRGAFGYFASSKVAMTEEEVLQEKYYVAVQSFLSPSWSRNSRVFKDWLAFRKVLVVNPTTGKAVVAVVGD